jgi:hypothetical protein
MTGYQASRPATRVYLHLNLAREQRALIRAPASGPQFARYRSCSPS